MGRGTFAGLTGLLLVAAVVRVWALDFCLPGAQCRPDEQVNALVGLSIAGGDLNPHFFSYPSLYFYLLALVDRGLFLFGDLAERARVAGGLSPFLLAGRAVSVVAGCLTVPVVWLIGRRLGSATTGWLAAALLTVNYLHVRDSHFMAPDVVTGLLVTLALALILRALDSGTARDFVVAGLAVGLATSTKYNAGVVGLSLLVACGFASDAHPERRWARFLRLSWPAVAVAAVAFLLTSPFVLLDFGSFTEQFGWELRHFRSGMYEGVRPNGSFLYYATHVLPHGFGVLPLALAAVGCLAWITRRDRRGLTLLSFVVGYFLLVTGGTTVFARYLVPLVPALCVGAAVGLERVATALPRRYARMAPAGLLAVALAQPLWNTVAFDRLLARDDTREQAAAWITSNLYPGTILQVGGRGVQHWALDPGTVPGFRLLNQDDRTQPYILERPPAGLARSGVRYVLTHDHPLLYSTLEPGVEDRLRSEARTLACFDGLGEADGPAFDYEDAFYLPFVGFAGVGRPGPRICVYDLTQPPG